MQNKKFLNYKGVRVNAFGMPQLGSYKNTRREDTTEEKRIYNISFPSPFRDGALKNLLVMYDIPDDRKKERDWFRRQLVKFGYVMIQRSVWVGPSPLPKNFLDYAKEIKISDKLVTFKLAKPYDPSTRSHS